MWSVEQTLSRAAITAWLALPGVFLAGCETRVVELSRAVDGEVVVGPDAPAGIVELFPANLNTGDSAKAKDLGILYPNHEALVPSNLAPVQIHWKSHKDLNRFELVIEAGDRRFRFYTAQHSWSLTGEQWRDLLAGGEPRQLHLRLRGMDADRPDRLKRADTVEMRVSQADVPGPVYFWSTDAQGIMRATIDARVATKFYPDADQDAPVCVGCHTLSRDGQRMAVAYDGEQLRQLSIADGAPLVRQQPQEPRLGYGWGTFDPGATRLLLAHKGRLSLLDSDNGEVLLQVDLGEGVGATHPDWAPDGRHVAVTLMGDKWDDNKKVDRSDIARIPVAIDGTFGSPEVLVASSDEHQTHSFPAYSPDGRWIAFARTDGKSKDAKKSTLWLVAADGAGGPIELARLNSRVGTENKAKDMGNSMPTWAPSLVSGTYWLAFSSTRDYGEHRMDDKRDQLWAAAIKAQMEPGQDPSTPAFWLPFQQMQDSNHRAFWALTNARPCSARSEICDQDDNDCDGAVDEDCCTPEAERCGDRVDNDCDGQRDEGCGCGLIEVCGNDEDEDCDMRVGEDCLL